MPPSSHPNDTATACYITISSCRAQCVHACGTVVDPGRQGKLTRVEYGGGASEGRRRGSASIVIQPLVNAHRRMQCRARAVQIESLS